MNFISKKVIYLFPETLSYCKFWDMTLKFPFMLIFLIMKIQVDTLSGMKIGLVKEGFEQENGDLKVNDMVKETVLNLSSRGADVGDVSIPLHKLGKVILSTLVSLI